MSFKKLFACFLLICVRMCATTCKQTSVGNLQDSVLPFHPVGSRDLIEIVQLGGQYLDALSRFL